jgi:uncharacterized membrane protein
MKQQGLDANFASQHGDIEFLSRRNCSIGPGSLIAVFASLVALSFGFGAVFASYGPWLILPFAGLEMLAVGCAFFTCGRRVGDFERISVGAHAVTIEQVQGKRRVVQEFNPRWARLSVLRQPADVKVLLSQSGKQVELGRHLGVERRLAFANDFGAALRAAANA